jgi:hypothetical protein
MKPTIDEVKSLVERLYERNSVGCCLHIEDESVQFCLEYAKKNNCEECIGIAEKLLLMPKTQRKKLYLGH